MRWAFASVTASFVASAVVCSLAAQPASAAPQNAGSSSAPSQAQPPAKSPSTEGLPAAEFLVPPGGGAYEVPVKIGEVCILTFPGEVTHSAVRSVPTFEVNPWNKDSLAVRALPGATSATLAVATQSGAIKVNVTLRVGRTGERTLALVTFRAVTAEEAYEAKVAAEVAKRSAPLLAQLEAERQRLEREIVDKRERVILERAREHSEGKKLRGIARSADQQVVVRVERSFVLGDDAYVPFVIDNRSKAPFAVAQALVTTAKEPQGEKPAQDGPETGAANGSTTGAPLPAQTAALHTAKPATGLGAVAAKSSLAGVVVLRDAAKLRGKQITLTVAEVGTQRVVKLGGISLP